MTFLEQFLKHYSIKFNENDVIVFPNNRPIIEFRNLLHSIVSENSWFPEITTLNDLLNREFPTNSPEFLEKVLALNEALSNALEEKKGDLNNFDFVAKLIEDFDEVQREKIDPKDIFSKVSYIKLLEKWEIEVDTLGDLGKNNLLFWEKLVSIFSKYQENLQQSNFQSQSQVLGLINEVESFREFVKTKSKFWFVGFNNFNASELHFIAELGKTNEIESVFDIDHYYLDNNLDSAGKFLIKSGSKISFNKTFLDANWRFRNQRFIHSVSAGNIAMLTSVFRKLISEARSKKTAVVFLDQSLLQTAVFSLPKALNQVNIGSGIQLQFTFGYSLVANFLDWNKNSLFEVLKQLSIRRFKSVQITYENQRNSRSIWSSFNDLQSFLKQLEFDNSDTLQHTFSSAVISKCISCLDRYLKNKLRFEKLPEEFVKKAFLSELKTNTIDTISDKTSNIQFLGLLETRNIDFDNVIIVSFNDSVFPGSIISNSIIPNDVRSRFGLQMPNDSEGLLSYYFFQSIQRAESISLLSIQSDSGFNSSEPSRYLNQLKNSFPGFEDVFVQKRTSFMYDDEINGETIVIPQNPKIKLKIINYLSQKGCSVSALNLLIRNPIDFYNQYVLGLKESETILDEVSHAELGTLFHNVLEDLYKPFVSTKLTRDTFKEIEKRRYDAIENRIEELNKKLSPSKSILKLYKNICSVWIDKFLQFDLSRIKAGRHIVLKDLEERCEIELKLQLEENCATIKLVGSIDRVEEENGVIRLIDYKTGKVEQKDLRIDDFSVVMDNLDFSKANQLLYYSLLYSHINKFKKIESAIYSCRNNLSGILPLMIQGKSFVDNDDLIAYADAVKIKLESILKSDFQFEESTEFKSKFTDLMV